MQEPSVSHRSAGEIEVREALSSLELGDPVVGDSPKAEVQPLELGELFELS